MCGIAGFHGMPGFDERDLSGLTDRIAHRGPDGSAGRLWPETGTGLGHRRLAIIDLSAEANQPMTYRDSGLWLVYNGEIFNYVELREELKAQGHSFTTASDSEVVLAAFQQWDIDAFRRFNGMWAMAIYDERQHRLVLSIDRFGVKPLYLWNKFGGVAFASELKAFGGLARRQRLSWDPAGVRTALLSVGALEASGHSLFQDVEPLAPGTLLEMSPKGRRTVRWWDLAQELVDVPADFEGQARQFKDLFFDACRLRLRSDVPVATSLSGGLDSSAVLSALASFRKGTVGHAAQTFPHTAFIHEFPGTAQDERHYAEAVINATGMKPVWVRENADEFLGTLDDVLYSNECVYPGIPDGPWRIYREQRRHGIKVSLDGHGADEYLGGYHEYTYLKILQSWGNPARAASLVNQVRDQMGPYFSWKTLAKGMVRGLLKPQDPSMFVSLVQTRLEDSWKPLKFRPLQDDIYHAQIPASPKGFDLVNRALFDDFHARVLPRILRNFDLMAMAHGVEVRMPFLDYRLVKLGFSLPSDSKIGGGYTKRIVREALKGVLVEEVRLRKLKLGFNSPLQSWLTTKLRPWVEQVLADGSPFDEFIDRRLLAAQYRRWTRGGAPVAAADAARFWKMASALRLAKLMETRLQPQAGV